MHNTKTSLNGWATWSWCQVNIGSGEKCWLLHFVPNLISAKLVYLACLYFVPNGIPCDLKIIGEVSHIQFFTGYRKIIMVISSNGTFLFIQALYRWDRQKQYTSIFLMLGNHFLQINVFIEDTENVWVGLKTNPTEYISG